MPYLTVRDIEIYFDHAGAGGLCLRSLARGSICGAALLDTLGWERVRVIGVSFGGMVALELVLGHSDRVAKLVLCCTSPGGEGGSSYPLHTLQNLPAEERARVMVSISDTRCDAGWAGDYPGKLEELIRNFTDDPFAEEPGHQSRNRGRAASALMRRRDSALRRARPALAPRLALI
jgi:pimeloyl-ACP methyl ester carboxylesterase